MTYFTERSYFVVDDATQNPRLGSTLGVLKTDFGDNAILLDQVNQHIPLTTILGGGGEEMTDQPALKCLPPASTLDVGVKVIVTTLQLKSDDTDICKLTYSQTSLSWTKRDYKSCYR